MGGGSDGVVGGAGVDATFPDRHLTQVDVADHLPQLRPEGAHTRPAGKGGQRIR